MKSFGLVQLDVLVQQQLLELLLAEAQVLQLLPGLCLLSAVLLLLLLEPLVGLRCLLAQPPQQAVLLLQALRQQGAVRDRVQQLEDLF